MKTISAKIIGAFIIITIVVIGLKLSDSLLAKASTNNNICGINNGVIWNGTNCVRVCDQFHPWNPVEQKCSTNVNYYGNINYGYGNNCALAYGNNFYFNGQNCVERNLKPKANYYGNPYNGGTTEPVYGQINYNNLNQISNSVNINWYTNNNIPNNPNINYPTNYCLGNCYLDTPIPSVKKTEYYIYTITTTVSQPKGIPVYLGQNYQNYNYVNNLNYYGNSYGNQNYDYLNNNYYSNNQYFDYGNANPNYSDQNYPYYNPVNNQGSYFNYGESGYYDNNGVYHY